MVALGDFCWRFTTPESELIEQERRQAEQEKMRAEDLEALLQRYRERFGDLPE